MNTNISGSHYFKKKRDDNSNYESGIGIVERSDNDFSGGGDFSSSDGGGDDGGD